MCKIPKKLRTQILFLEEILKKMNLFSFSKNSILYQVLKKVFITLGSVLFIALCLWSIFQYKSINNEAEDSLRALGQSFQETFVNILKDEKQTDDLKLIEDFLVSKKEVAGVTIFNKDNKLIFKKGDFILLDKRGSTVSTEEKKNSKNLYSIFMSIYSESTKSKIGEVIIFGYKEPLTKKLTNNLIEAFIYTFSIVITLCFIVYTITLKTLVIPLEELKEKISKVNYSNLKKIKFDYQEENEISFLGENFNTMIMHTNRFHRLLKKSLDDLEQQNVVLEERVIERTKDVTNILENLGQGFMVFDEYGVILEDVSQAATEFFKEDLVYNNMANVLTMDSEKRKSFEKWLKQVWGGRLLFKDLVGFAPKSFKKGKRHLKLEYRPIYEIEDGKVTRKIEKVICIATDVTKEKQLEEKAQREREQSQMVLLIIERPIELVDLIDDFKDFTTEFLYENSDWTLDEVFRKFHTFKASFSQFRISEMVNVIHDIESKVSQWIDDSGERKSLLKEKELKELAEDVKLCNDAFYEFMRTNRLIIEMANHALLSEDAHEFTSIKQVGQFMQKKFGKDSQVYKEFEEDFVLKKVSGSFERFESVVQEVSSNQGKFVSYIIDESELKINTDDYSDFLSSCVHLFRNAVDHGIEDPSERVDKNKPEQGKITVSFEEKGKEFFRLKVKDDGRGINPGVIKKAALKLGLKSESEIMNLKDEELIQLIFDQGISSKEKVTDVSGRGVGMDAIKAEAEKVGGKVWVESQVDVGTTFFADLPLNIKNRKSS